MRKLKLTTAALTCALAVFSWQLPALADYVGGLDPYGDNYLSLRQYPSSRSMELSRMGPNTMVEVLDRDGPWLYIQTRDGRIGWAHGRYIRSGYPRASAPPPPPPPGFGSGTPGGAPAAGGWQMPGAQPGIPPQSGPGFDNSPEPAGDVNPSAPPPDNSTPQSTDGGPYEWLAGHLERFHGPLKYYP
ncbi:SH3 domain-containing protein [Roseibium sp.]|uniref:SH3 domain-containing protein n=1 Tax=Roseibium sp. TaxID=1936156 RepID=UPI003A96E8E6